MKKSSPSTPELREVAFSYKTAADLELPVSPGFNSRPPQLSPTDYVTWCERMLKDLPQSRLNSEQRFAVKAPLEFSI